MDGASHENPVEIDISGFDLGSAREFLRVWSTPDQGMSCFVQPEHLAADPFLMGMVLIDIVRHSAKAWSQAVNISEAEAEARIWEGFEAERHHYTTGIKQVGKDFH